MDDSLISGGQNQKPQKVGDQEQKNRDFQSVSPFGIEKRTIIKVIMGTIFLIVLCLVAIILYQKASAPTQVTLQWWGLWEDSQIMRGIISDFEKDHPKILVQYTKQDPNQYRNRLLARIQNGTGPDIYRFHNTWVPMLAPALIPLPSDVITPQDFQKVYYPVIQQDMIKNGALYGIPLGTDTLSLFVNSDLLTAAHTKVPTTWDDFVKVAQGITVKDGSGKIQVAGAAMGTYGNITHASDILAMLFAQQGVDFSNFSDPKYTQNETDVLTFYTSFAQTSQNANANQGVWDRSLDESILAFARGELAMYFGYSWDIFRIQQLNKQLHFSVNPVPALYNKNMTIASYWAEGVSSRSQHQKEALLFMRYLTQRETSLHFYADASKTRIFGELYPRQDLSSTLQNNTLVYPFVSQLPNATSSYFSSDTHDGSQGLNSQANTYLENAINSIIGSGGSIQTSLTTLDQGIAQILQQYGIKKTSSSNNNTLQ